MFELLAPENNQPLESFCVGSSSTSGTDIECMKFILHRNTGTPEEMITKTDLSMSQFAMEKINSHPNKRGLEAMKKAMVLILLLYHRHHQDCHMELH